MKITELAAMVVLTLIATSCGSSPQSGGDTSNTKPPVEPSDPGTPITACWEGATGECDELSEAQCIADVRCMPLRASYVYDSFCLDPELELEWVVGCEHPQPCLGSEKFVRCADVRSCDEGTFYASLQGAPSSFWQFPNSCVPKGWTVQHPKNVQFAECETMRSLEDFQDEFPCLGRSLDECEATEECEIKRGRRWNESGCCWGDLEPLHCVPFIAMSTGGTYIRLDPSGQKWKMWRYALHDDWPPAPGPFERLNCTPSSEP